VSFVGPLFPTVDLRATSSFARLSPLAKGRIIGLREAGVKRPEIRKRVKKKDVEAIGRRQQAVGSRQ